MMQERIRLLKTHEDFEACERIQKAVWGALGSASEVLTVTQKYGGAVVGAIVGKKLVGFAHTFLARRNGQLIHWSSMMAVLRGFRDRGLGYKMKLAQRRIALQQGLRSICWTYDPLQSRNATLNITRLGARVEEYVPDYYGHFPSALERGLPSDRFVVDWRIASADVGRRLQRRSIEPPDLSLPRVNQTLEDSQGFLRNRKIRFSLREPWMLVEIPPNADAMRRRALRLARQWRFETRKIFERYLSAGYRVEDFIPSRTPTGGRCFYVLKRS